MHRSALSWG